ncbi:seipin-2 [Diospyros lotus]|uniref:seipin-2 n=1 Tax=Diospyros lotus TaxID=55363 RepID=UPI00224F336C|nr:seipin-2 [Diospyros lotus]
MEDSKLSATNDDDDDHQFVDALCEFPFYDCIDTPEPERSISSSPSVSQLETNADVSLQPSPSPEILSPPGLRRRRSLSHHVRKEAPGSGSTGSNPNSSLSSDSATAAERKCRIFRNFEENERRSEKPEFSRVRINSESPGHCVDEVDEESKETSTVTAANDDDINQSVAVDLASGGNDESSSSFLFVLAGLVIKAIGFQISLMVSFFTFPIWLLCCSFMFVADPFGALRRVRDYLMGKVLGMWGVMCDNISPFVYEWLKEYNHIWKLALRFGWGFLWATYVCIVLVSLLVSAFVVSGLTLRHLVEEPIQMKETLTFDYTKNSPVAFVQMSSCPRERHGVPYRDKNEVGSLGGPRVIPVKHKLQVTVSLTLPESDYNRNLGIFQVRVDFLSASGKAIASSSRPCMLQFKSPPIRLLLTFLKAVPLVAGYSSETQTLTFKFRGFAEGDIPTACLRVTIEQRAEFQPGAGIPEIYDASLLLESELPLLKRIIWRWKTTLFIWVGMTMFAAELLFVFLFCRPIIMPRGRPRDGSPGNAAQINHPALSS